jgi:2-methylcitrate dehydratase PrpD
MTTPHVTTLARWIAGVSYDDIPERVRRAARFQLLDMIAAAHASAGAHEVSPVVNGLDTLAGAGNAGTATIFATGRRASTTDAAMANAAFSMAHDFDDIVWMGHTCHSAVFAPLAVAEREGATTRALVTAIVVANEIGGRLGASSFLGPLNGQMWTFIHLVGAAAATSKLLALGAEATAHALGIALAQPNFALQPGFMAPTSKLLAASTPIATGIQAAYFARAGMTGHPGILEDRRGFWKRFSFLPMPFMLGKLGEFWTLDTLTLKTYPGCHYFQTALTALERILARRGPLAARDVRRVLVDTTKLGCEVTRFAGDYVGAQGEMTPVRVNFDLAASCAIFLTAGRLTPDEMSTEWMESRREDLAGWYRRIEVRHDPALTAKVLAGARGISTGKRALREIGIGDVRTLSRRYAEEYGSRLFSLRDAALLAQRATRALTRPRGPRDETSHEGVPLFFPGRVTIELTGGERDEERVDLPVGSIASPHATAALEAKVLASLERTVGEDRARRALAAGLAAETLDLGELVRRLSV